MSNSDDFELNPCAICVTTKAKTINTPGFDGVHQNCSRCGEFKILDTALAIMHGGLGDEI